MINVISKIDQEPNSKILFSISSSDIIFIDDNLDFTSPKTHILSDGLILDFSSGVYYLKIGEEYFSQIITLTINSNVKLGFEKTAIPVRLLSRHPEIVKWDKHRYRRF